MNENDDYDDVSVGFPPWRDLCLWGGESSTHIVEMTQFYFHDFLSKRSVNQLFLNIISQYIKLRIDFTKYFPSK